MPNSSDATTQLILSELRDLRSETTEGFNRGGERLAALETAMKSLLGNGHPGRLTQLEITVEGLKSLKNRMLGYLGLVSLLFTAFLVMHDHIICWLSK